MAEQIIGIAFAGAFVLAVGTIGTDQLYYKPMAQSLADDLATNSIVEDAPDNTQTRADDLMSYRGRGHIFLMEHMQNASDFKIANDFGLTLWRLQSPEGSPTVDLGTSRGRRIFDVTKAFLSAKILNTSAVIDNRDPARGPVFIHDGLEQSHFDVTMDFLKAEYGTAANMPNELIVVTYHKGNVGIFVDEGGAELAKSPYAEYINSSPWNPSFAHKGIVERGFDIFNRNPG